MFQAGLKVLGNRVQLFKHEGSGFGALGVGS